MSGIVGTHLIAQVGFIVRDVEASKRKWAEFLGVDVPPTQSAGDYATTGTAYRGEPAPEASCLMAFFDVGPGLQLELIQPNEAPSTWRDFLNEHGEGMHHIAFQVRDSGARIAAAEAAGLKLVQHGLYGDGSGEYNYLEAPELHCIVELLESYHKQ
ncbi:MAG: VOC family protein [Clostridia bacterium]|nr:VOC family protein [Clostridia bacterium]